MTEQEARRALVEAGHRLAAEGLVARSWGNVSVRLDGSTMAVTPSGVLWNNVTEEQISLVDLETGEWRGTWKPSGERKVHREIYRRRPEVNAVVHTHQNAASACAAARQPVPVPTGVVPCAPYALPGTKTLTRATVAALGPGATVLLANHGVFTTGRDLGQAFAEAAMLEHDCADYLEVVAPRPLPARADAKWQSSWLTPLDTESGAFFSAAPYTVAWSQRGKPLLAVLDDLAQLAGSQVPCRAEPSPRLDACLIRNRGAVVRGPDAEALAMVIEKAARAVIAGEGLGGARRFPAWEARLMRWVYKNSYRKIGSGK
jgi:L-fuculose-phosphate aldolase